MMPPLLRVLHLENNLCDQELVRATLLGETLRCAFSYVTNKEEFAAALEQGGFDVILSNFTLPGYSGTEALDLAKVRCPDVPFIFVSGTIGEHQAIESLKSGATDYVLKERLERLRPAVLRALREQDERTARNDALEALRRSEERFREMAECMEDVFYVTALDTGHRSYVSPAFAQIWGSPVAGLYDRPAEWNAAIVPEDRPRVLAAQAELSQGREFRLKYRIQRPDGTQRWIEDRSYLVREPGGETKRAVGVATDITQQHKLESQLRQAQKMEAVGQLAGGVAHDFNNVLTIVIGWTRLLLDQESMPPDAIPPLTQIFNAGTRAANLTRQLLVFSNKQVINRHAIDLNVVTSEISQMLLRVIGEHITMKLVLSEEPCMAEADAGMIEQVLMNLAVNARDAMPDGGKLTIATSTITIDDPVARGHPCAQAGVFVCLSIKDTGCGISAEDLQRIFEPFFTTKALGRGTGLGLSMVQGIVQQHEGWIELESTVGAGTQFRILLPCISGPSEPSITVTPEADPVSDGSETLLLVEDEPAVREFAVAVLKSHGYRVLQATSGVEALEVWQRHGTRIVLLVTDLVLPDGLSGVELAARLCKEKPDLKVVLTSGYANQPGGEEFQAPANMHFIQKPYKPQTLAHAVRTTLDSNPPSEAPV